MLGTHFAELLTQGIFAYAGEACLMLVGGVHRVLVRKVHSVVNMGHRVRIAEVRYLALRVEVVVVGNGAPVIENGKDQQLVLGVGNGLGQDLGNVVGHSEGIAADEVLTDAINWEI